MLGWSLEVEFSGFARVERDVTRFVTFCDLHLCDGLPFIHGNEPGFVLPATAQVDDQLIFVLS